MSEYSGFDKATPSPQDVNSFHFNSDKDSSAYSQHHTLGKGPNQAAPGDHNHTGLYVELDELTTLELNLLNGWVGSSIGTYGTPAFMLEYNHVELFGLVDPTAATDNTIAELPAGVRPGRELVFTTGGPNGAGTAWVSVPIIITVAGLIIRSGLASVTQYVSLAGINFRAQF